MPKPTAALPEWEQVLSAAAQLQQQSVCAATASNTTGNPLPYDLDDMAPGLAEYKGLDPAWHAWGTVQAACADAAMVIFDAVSQLQGR